MLTCPNKGLKKGILFPQLYPSNSDVLPSRHDRTLDRNRYAVQISFSQGVDHFAGGSIGGFGADAIYLVGRTI